MEVAVMEKAMRLDRYLVEMKKGSRSEVKKMIKSGRVSVDGEICREAERKIQPSASEVSLDGTQVGYAAYEYFMLNKPAGVVSATEDGRHKTVVSLIEDAKRRDLFPVGRLDIDTEGLLLITNDGKLAHQLLSPRRHVDKTYYARIEGNVTEDLVPLFQSGVDIGTEDAPEMTLPARLVILESGPVSCVRLTIQEGKYHQIKRMFQAVGMKVVYLKRETMGPLVLDPDLKPGEYRPLTLEEKKKLGVLE